MVAEKQVRVHIVDVLRQIAEQHDGVVKPEDVVAAAEPKDSPLHNSFCWDDNEAARLYRLHQARNILRVCATYIDNGSERVATRAFVSLTPDREDEGGGYRTMESILQVTAQRNQMLADALSELQAFERKYGALKELAAVFVAARRIRKEARCKIQSERSRL